MRVRPRGSAWNVPSITTGTTGTFARRTISAAPGRIGPISPSSEREPSGKTQITLPDPGLQQATPSHVTALRGARPNPFRGSTAIELSLAHEAHVELGVYDVRGARVRTLGGGTFGAGVHTLVWDGRNDAGLAAPQGIYFIRMTTGSKSFVRKALLMP